MEHVGDLRHDAHLVLRLGLVCAVQREGVYAERRGEVDLVVLIRANGVACRREIAEVDTFGRGDEILTRDGRGAGDDGRGARGTSVVEKSGGSAREREGGCGTRWLRRDGRVGVRRYAHHAGTGAARGVFLVHGAGGGEVGAVVFAQELPRAGGTALRAGVGVQSEDSAVYRSTSSRIVPVLRPIVADGSA